MDRPMQNAPKFDALLPPQMALRAEEIGVSKARLDAPTTLVLAVLAGAFVGLVFCLEYSTLTWAAFVSRNLVPVTLGNVIGGAGMVGAVYWFVYLRPRATSQPR